MKTLVTICAKGTNKGLPGKHLLSLHSRPLLDWTLAQANEFRCDQRNDTTVVLNTDAWSGTLLMELAQARGIEFRERPPDLLREHTPKMLVVRYAYYQMGGDFDYVIDLDATNPMRSTADILRALELAVDSGKNVLSAVRARKNPYFNQVECWRGSCLLSKTAIVDEHVVFTRQQAPVVYDLNASINVFHRETIEKEHIKSYTEAPFTIYEMPQESAFDIDTEQDFRIVELLMGGIEG